MNIAITTDWLVTRGGAERVIAEMLNIWPEADLFTTVCNPHVLSHVPHTSTLQRWHHIVRSHRLLLPWMPQAVEQWDLRNYDLVISSSHAVAKGCIPPPTAHHFCYCHTPMRYAWEMEEEYLDDFGLIGPARSLARHSLENIKRWDRTTAKRVDTFIANSQVVQQRIRNVYNRESTVLHPPVDDRFFQDFGQHTSEYFLTVGRLVPYKRTDLLIEVANNLQLPLKIAGRGPDENKLQAMAGPSVEFLGYVPEDDLPALYAGAAALLFPTEEDAGIVPLEAQACGTPVIAYGKGGAMDTVVHGITGVLFKEQSADSLEAALQLFRTMNFSAENIRTHAAQFSGAQFREKLERLIVEHCVQST